MRTPDPLAFAVAAAGLAVVTALLGLVLRRQLRRVASLRTAVLVLAASTLGIALVAALLATRLMLIEGRELRLFLVVLASAAGFAGLLAVVVSRSIASDVARLGLTAQRVEAGDLAARTGIERRDELGRAAHALDAMVARLDQLERERAGAEAERRTMLTSISHDLRTPLTAMRAAVEALADGVAPDPERYLTSMAHDLAALGSLIDDLFVLARIEAGERTEARDPVDLAEVVDEAVEALGPAAHARGVELAVATTGAAFTHGSAAELGRVVRNLLDNAIRHSPPGGVVTCRVRAEPEPTVTVLDEGPGFPPDFAPRAFEAFHRADEARRRDTGGAGLGLAIARGLVTAHGGEISIEPGAGGRVTFRLPRGDLHASPSG